MSLNTINPRYRGERDAISRHVTRDAARAHAHALNGERVEGPRGHRFIYVVNPGVRVASEFREGRRIRLGWPWRVYRVWA